MEQAGPGPAYRRSSPPLNADIDRGWAAQRSALAPFVVWVHTRGMAEAPLNRVFLTDVRGNDLYLRATWHPDSNTIVFSHWNGQICTASTPVALTDCPKLIDLMVRSLSAVADRSLPLAKQPAPQSVIERLKDRLRPKLAEVIDASTRSLASGRLNREQRRSS
jgi:hypothetical protein